MSRQQRGINNGFFGKTHTEEAKELIRLGALNREKDPKPGFKVDVLDTHTGVLTSYKSMRAAARALGTSHGNLAKYTDKLWKNQYRITVNKN
jgi:group I intron endonuclease